MRLIKLFVISSVLLAIASCSTPEPAEVVVRDEYFFPPINVVAMPAPVTMRDVEVYVVNETNYEEFVQRFKNANGGRLVFIATSLSDYTDMSLNLADLRRYIAQQKEIILYYEKSVSQQRAELDRVNNTQ